MTVVSDNTILLLNLNILTVNIVTQSCHYMVNDHACALPQVPQRGNRFFFFNWYSLHARLNSHYEAWSYKKKKHEKVKAYRKSNQKEPTVKRYLLILDLKPLRS